MATAKVGEEGAVGGESFCMRWLIFPPVSIGVPFAFVMASQGKGVGESIPDGAAKCRSGYYLASQRNI